VLTAVWHTAFVKRVTFVFWACVIALQIAGIALNCFGGNLNSPTRLAGMLLLSPGMWIMFPWIEPHIASNAPVTQYAASLGIAVAMNFGFAGLLQLLFWAIRTLERGKSRGETQDVHRG